MSKIIYIIIYLICSTFGLIMIKIGTSNTSFNISSIYLGMNLSWKLLIGFLSYIISFVLWTIVISKYNLSFIYPLVTAILFILVMISSAIFLKENVTISQIIGVFVIIIGVFITTIRK